MLPPCVKVCAQATVVAPTLIGRKWTLPVLTAVHRGADRFSDVATLLSPVTPRALTQALDGLAEADLLARDVVASRPRRATYQTNARSTQLAHAADELAVAAA